MTQQTPHAIDDIVRGRVGWVRDGRIGLRIDGSDYELHLVLAGDPHALPPEGKRVRGVIHGKALKINVAHAGGQFIEPVLGHPRIVNGTVIAVDPAENRLLAQVVVPMWVDVAEGQSARDFATGQLVNFYFASGVSFTPVAG
jgi:hypothetical protein